MPLFKRKDYGYGGYEQSTRASFARPARHFSSWKLFATVLLIALLIASMTWFLVQAKG